MKKLLPVLIVTLLAAGSACGEDLKPKDTFSVIHSRKSVRNFTGAPVGRSDLDRIIRAGMAAPTAVNRQPWSFIVITDREKLAALAAGLPYARMLTQAGAAIIVCTDPAEAYDKSRDLAIIDASLAGENILLAIEALGLGGVWTAAFPYADRMKHVRSVLNIPPEIIPLNVIPVGVPAGADQPKDKFNAGKIHRDKW